MNPAFFISTYKRRFALATVLWCIAWPVLMYFERGDITGPQAWFWIIGVLNYPVAAIVYSLLDTLIKSFIGKPWVVFITTIAVISAGMPFYYDRYGFALGVSVEARFF